MSTTDNGPRRLLDVTLLTAVAFMAGGYLQRFLAVELASAGAGTEAFAPWMLVPLLLQGAVGFLGLAWILRDRYPLFLLWTSGMLGWAAASVLALVLVGWSFYEHHMLFLLGLVTALVLAGRMQVGASAALKMSAIYTIGFSAAWAVLVLGIAGATFLVHSGPAWLETAGISVQALAALSTVAQDFIIGATAALGVKWVRERFAAPEVSGVRHVVLVRSSHEEFGGVL